MLKMIEHLLLNIVKNFAKGFRGEAFQNTAGARTEAERPTAMHNFWLMASWKVGRRFTALSKICVKRQSSFWLNVYVNKQNCRCQMMSEALQKLPMHPEKVKV